MSDRESGPTVVFVCLHGSAKSLIAAEHLTQLARAQGSSLRGESAGVEPDAEVPAAVVGGLAGDGIDVRGYTPRLVTADLLRSATRVVSFGCPLDHLVVNSRFVEQWNDLPMVSDGYETARAAIVARVERLVNDWPAI